MIKSKLILVILPLVSLLSCRKPNFNYPIAALKYQSDKGSLNESYEVNEHVTPSTVGIFAGSDTLAGSSSDSVKFIFLSRYSSQLTGSYCNLAITHTYPKSRLDNVNGSWTFKNYDMIFEAFNGPIPIANRAIRQSSSVDIDLRPTQNSTTYSLSNNAGDPTLAVEVVSKGNNYSWGLVQSNFYPTWGSNTLFNPVQVTANFHGKLVNSSSTDTLTVTNLFFSGIFTSSK